MGFLVRVAQANNQWNIGAELGSDPMESAFARTLTAGIKGVAMVLDQEVQPLTSDSTKCWACQEVQGFSCHVLVIITLLFCSFALLHRLFICPKRWGLPCSGVWCLFEFLLSSRENLELVFVTNAGVIGDAAWRKQGCLNFTWKFGKPILFLSMKQTKSFHGCQLPVHIFGQVLVPASLAGLS